MEYQPSPYNVCEIVDKGSGKHRVLHKPRFFPDQCVHHLMILLIQERLERRIDANAIAGIKKKGIHFGYSKIKRWLRTSKRLTKHCLKGDIKKCYDNIRPKQIMKALRKFIKDPKFLEIMRRIAYSHNSLPLGNYTSNWFLNLILLPFDKFCSSADGVSHYIRFVDDFILLSPNKRKLHKLLPKISLILAELGLTLKKNYQIFPVDKRGIDMLGYRFWHKYTLLRKRNALHIARFARAWKKKPTPKRAVRVLTSIGNLKWFNSHNFYVKHISDIDKKELKEYANRHYGSTRRRH